MRLHQAEALLQSCQPTICAAPEARLPQGSPGGLMGLYIVRMLGTGCLAMLHTAATGILNQCMHVELSSWRL